MRKLGFSFALLCGVLGSGMSVAHAGDFTESIGPDQNIVVKTIPEVGAHCILRNAVGIAVAMHTPQSINVLKSAGSTSVRCISQDGMWRGRAIIKPNVDGLGILYSLPWEAMSLANNIAGGLQDEGGVARIFSGSVRLPSTIVIKMETSNQVIGNAEIASRDDAIANQPQPDLKPTSEAPQVQPASTHHAVKHHRHHVYHTENSHS